MIAEVPEWWFYAMFGVACAGVMVATYRGWTDRKQETTAKQGMLDDRFKMAIDLVRRKNVAARVGGIYVLADMARLYPQYNHVRVMEIFVSMLPRRIPGSSSQLWFESDENVVVAIRSYVENRGSVQFRVERKADFSLDERLHPTEYEMKGGKLVLRA